MGYVYKNVYGVLAVQDEATINEPKVIRFIDPHYRERFTIPDGDQILIRYAGSSSASFDRSAAAAAVLLIKKAWSMVSFSSNDQTRPVICEAFENPAQARKFPLWSATITVSPGRHSPSMRSTAPENTQG